MSWQQIDEQYSISYVFKGAFVPKLKDPRSKEFVPRMGAGWLLAGEEYVLEVEEDEAEEAKHERRAYVAPKEQGCPLGKRGRDLLTEELKGLSA